MDPLRLEKGGYVKAGYFTPEAVVEYPEAVVQYPALLAIIDKQVYMGCEYESQNGIL